MKKSLLAALALFAVANTALADSVIVVRPPIGSGAAGIIPQNAFTAGGAPTVPSNPSTPTAPNTSIVFTSVGFSSGVTTRVIDGMLGMQREYSMPWGNPYCEVVDSSAKNLTSIMGPEYYPGAGSNTPSIMFNPKVVGVYQIVVSCGQNSQNHNPAVQFNLTVN